LHFCRRRSRREEQQQNDLNEVYAQPPLSLICCGFVAEYAIQQAVRQVLKQTESPNPFHSNLSTLPISLSSLAFAGALDKIPDKAVIG